MKKHIIILTTLLLTLTVAYGQTNVSGGIYSNTTWTQANSPYIITDTVVVFPGVTLTIQAGVEVKFNDNQRLEIRQANIVAIGTITDSITFTSNSSSPSPGKWIEIFLNQDLSSVFNYCHFRYATTSINRYTSNNNQSLHIKNSTFDLNQTSLYLSSNNYSTSFIDSCVFKNNTTVLQFLSKIIKMNNCTITNNQTGLDFAYSTVRNSIIDSNGTAIRINLNDSVLNCKIRNNNIGIQNPAVTANGGNVITGNNIENNVVGISLNTYGDSIYCNAICNNTSYNMKYLMSFSNNTYAKNNNWCSSDSILIESTIYDGYDNVQYGLVKIFPLDSTSCSPISPTTSINLVATENSLNVFPNPFSSSTNLTTNLPDLTVSIYNLCGQQVKQVKTNSQQTVLTRDNLPCGLYFLRVTKDNKVVASDKLVIVDN